MIRQGRDAVGTDYIVTASGMKRQQEPWRMKGHPEELNTPEPHAHVRKLWDKQQIDAFYSNQEVPELPQNDSPLDLLDKYDVIELLHHTKKISRKTAENFIKDKLGEADIKNFFGIAHWYRETVVHSLQDTPRHPYGTAQTRVYRALDRANGTLTISEIMRQAEVSRPTAIQLRRQHQQDRATPPDR